MDTSTPAVRRSMMVSTVLRGGPAAPRVLTGSVLLPLDDAAVAQAPGLIADARAEAEAHEGVAAFLEKRPPVWPAP